MIGLILWGLSIVAYVIYNLYTKNSKLETIVLQQSTVLDNIQGLINQSDKALKELDSKIWLEGDKELMPIFENLKAIQESLNDYRAK